MGTPSTPLAERRKRALIAAGGTGGHFYPGLVLAKTLRGRGWEPLLCVRRGDPALAVLEKEGLASVEMDLSGLPRSLGPGLIVFAWKLWKGFLLARQIAKDFKPDITIGMGGYLTFPCLLASRLQGIPGVLHDSNAVLGLANRAARLLGAKLFWGLPTVHGGGMLTGTPIRPSLWEIKPKEEARKRLGLACGQPLLLVFGGSQGARSVNRSVPAALKKLPVGCALQVLHLTGVNNFEETRRAYEGSAFAVKLLPFLEEMQWAYAACDLVLCRSGASTLAELASQEKPAVLVPYPLAAANHQEANAKILARAGAARLLLDRDIAEGLAPILEDLLWSQDSPAKRRSMAEAYARLGLPPAHETAERLADAVEKTSRQ
ncbi:MAG: UDP-N-acetylglucosamine--N-acetylmuramyl-(pentapeptide) pyrophosphoryl-undecaprenol N-acetylglucosamine transferase [Elusimicrobia bacterium]|nr:UDP-N-acetylglucosamine--N-acetylmuramyl-(pentapeptide) pyrophosphoryl-undecaprenol N-acetylglucosamine transferase [Elusimicrobiota bacterium]